MLRLDVDMKSSMTIGEVAAHFGLPAHTLRHWEAQGLLAPAREAGERRRYTEDDLYRVASILRGKDAGLSLPDIREVLTAGDPAARRRVLRRQHDTLAARLAELRTAMALLEVALSCTHEDLVTCPRFQGQLRELVADPAFGKTVRERPGVYREDQPAGDRSTKEFGAP